jgi:Leucine-rich repeat (LRR) protein
MTSLAKLQLGNNIIEKIEGLSSLVNLKELDLSFNNIEIIENLEVLVKLEVLTLFENRISKLENMETLVNLMIFSIGNNQIEDRNDVSKGQLLVKASLCCLSVCVWVCFWYSDVEIKVVILCSSLFNEAVSIETTQYWQKDNTF